MDPWKFSTIFLLAGGGIYFFKSFSYILFLVSLLAYQKLADASSSSNSSTK